MQEYGESHLILSAASTRQEQQEQRRLQARRETYGKHDLQLTEIDEEPENNVILLSRDNII